MKTKNQKQTVRTTYETRALTKATERLFKLLEEFGLLPSGAFDARHGWRLVSQPDEKRVILCVDWEE